MRSKLAAKTLLTLQFTAADPLQGRSVRGRVGRPKAMSCWLLLSGLFLIVACSSQVESPATQSTGVTVFEGARLIVGDGSEPIEDAAFVVEDDRFTAVGRRGELQVPAGAARVDLTGKTVIPTLVDLHVHLVTILSKAG